MPWRIALRMIDEQGWILRNDVVWDKQSSAFDSSFDHLRNTHEFIFHFVKSDDFYYDDEELRLFFNNVTEKKAKEGKTSSGVTGMKYRRNVMSSTALTDEEKQNALAELDKVVDMVNNGEIPDFRMFIRTAEDPPGNGVEVGKGEIHQRKRLLLSALQQKRHHAKRCVEHHASK